MEAAASDGPMEGLPLRLEKCSGTFPQPSHRTLEIAPATSRLHDVHSRLENAGAEIEGLEGLEHKRPDASSCLLPARVSHSSHRPYSF